MGGFYLFDGSEPLYPIHRNNASKLISRKLIEVPTESEIQDRDKRSPIAISLVFFQTIWFIAQCISRTASSSRPSPITKLEIVTIAYVSIYILTYLLSRGKPQHTNRPIRIQTSKVGNLKQIPDDLPFSYPTIYQPIWMVFFNEDSSVYLSRVKKVPLTYCGDPPKSYQRYETTTFYPVVLIVAISGAIYCIGWSLQTQVTFTEVVLWRLFSLAFYGIFIGPLAGALIRGLIPEQRNHTGGGERQGVSAITILFHILVMPTVILYYISRVGLVVLAILELRAVTDNSHGQVRWASLLPHI